MVRADQWDVKGMKGEERERERERARKGRNLEEELGRGEEAHLFTFRLHNKVQY